MICAYLLFAGMFASADEVMQYYGSKRVNGSKGVTNPSRKRYVDYFSTKISHGLQYSPVELLLKAIILEPPPHVGFGHHEAHLQFQVLQHFHESYQSEVQSVKWNDRKVLSMETSRSYSDRRWMWIFSTLETNQSSSPMFHTPNYFTFGSIHFSLTGRCPQNSHMTSRIMFQKLKSKIKLPNKSLVIIPTVKICLHSQFIIVLLHSPYQICRTELVAGLFSKI